MTGIGDPPTPPALPAENHDLFDGNIDPARTPHVTYLGLACPGLWRDADLAAGAMIKKRLAPIDLRYPAKDQFDLEVIGDSINKVARESAFLRCVTFQAINAEFRNGDLVIIESRNAQGLLEVTARQFRKNVGKIELSFPSNNPRFAAQRLILEGDLEKPDLKFIGKVIWIYDDMDGAGGLSAEAETGSAKDRAIKQ